VLTELVNGPRPVSHVATETYTWPMLPVELRPAGDDYIVTGLAREIAWARDRLVELGLAPV
jgi:hypothetical protein